MNPPAPELSAPQADVLGVRVDALDHAAVLSRCGDLMRGSRPAVLITANALLALDAARDADLAEACREAELVTADSIGLVWAASRLRQPKPARLPGIDLSIQLCAMAARTGVPVYLLGAAPGVAEAAAAHLKALVPDLSIAGARDGFFGAGEDGEIAREIAGAGARLIFVALGSPKQELWIHRNRSRLPPGLYVGVGGSFDVWAGNLRRAPVWLRRAGLEWMFRLLQEPSRYGRIFRLPVFAWRVEAARRRRFPT